MSQLCVTVERVLVSAHWICSETNSHFSSFILFYFPVTQLIDIRTITSAQATSQAAASFTNECNLSAIEDVVSYW